MPGKTAKVTITERQHDILITLHNAPTAPSHLRQRAAIILLAFNRRATQIADQLGLWRRQIGLWRRRWADAWTGSSHRMPRKPSRLAPGHRASPTAMAPVRPPREVHS